MTKHAEWIAQHPSTAIVYEPCSFCPGMSRYSLNIVHSMTETTYIASCGDCRCVLRLYLFHIAHFYTDNTMASLALSGALSDVLAKLLSAPSLLVQDVQFIVGADWRPLPELIAQCLDLEENKERSYERLEKAA